jgi:hypothetical protein
MVPRPKSRNTSPKHDARRAVWRAIREGQLTRQACERCGSNENIHGHHDDYGKPLVIRWLCARHHGEVHPGFRARSARIPITGRTVPRPRRAQDRVEPIIQAILETLDTDKAYRLPLVGRHPGTVVAPLYYWLKRRGGMRLRYRTAADGQAILAWVEAKRRKVSA